MRDSENRRERQEGVRQVNEAGREVAEGKREEAFQMPLWVPQTKKSAVIAAFCLLLCASVPASVIAFLFADKRSETRTEDINRSRDHVFRTICSQNNIGKADTIWRVSRAKTAFGTPEAARRELKREERLQVILNCEATFDNGGRAVPLAPADAGLYVEYVGKGRVPIVEHGQVVGHRAPESGKIADF